MNQHRPDSPLLLAGRYQTIRLLGQGISGRTWLATDLYSQSSFCVVKQFWTETTYSFVQMRSLSGLGLPRWLEEVQQDGVTYWIQEFIPGHNLAVLLAEKGCFEGAEVGRMLAALLPLLQRMHGEDVIHGDIKPENIVCDPAGNFILVDGGSIGSNPAYAAPEQITGNPVFASDLYSLGMTGIHLLTGIAPFHLLDTLPQSIDWHEWLPQGSHAQEQRELQILANLFDRLINPDVQHRLNIKGAIAELEKCQGIKSLLKHSSTVPKEQNRECDRTLIGHDGLFAGVNAIAFTPDHLTLASASDDKTIRLWDLKTNHVRSVLFGHSNFVKAVTFHPNNPQILASGSRDRTIKLWDLDTQRVIQTLTGHTHTVNAVLFNADGRLISGSSDKTIRLWNIQTGECIKLKGHQLAIHGLALHCSTLASASADSTVRFWDLETATVIQTLVGHTAAVKAIAFSPDGRYLATGSDDRTIRLWDRESGQCSRILPGHSWGISALTFSANGERLFSGSWDKTVKLWHIETGKEIGTMIGHQDAVTCVAIAADQRAIASGSTDRTIKLWSGID
jgi:WD40 repeat protein